MEMEDAATQAMTQEQPDEFDSNAICTLISTAGSYLPNRMVLFDDKFNWKVGRNPEADFVIGPSKRLSNIHFILFRTHEDPGTILLKDTSTNGTYLNNRRVVRDKATILSSGDEIAVGIGVDDDVLKFIVNIPRNRAELKSEGVYAAYDMSTTLGTGAFATVKKAIKRDDGKPYAIKIISKNKITDGQAVQREIKILKQLKNDYVVGMHDVFEDSNHFYLVMDYIKGGDLMDFVLQNGRIPEAASREITRQIVSAVAYVHSLGISHRDLKPDNILIEQDSPVKIKVSDFGLAKVSAHQSMLRTFCGTLAYLAPEVMDTRGKRNNPTGPVYSNLVDMWSIGCLAFVILTGYLPFDGSTQDNLYANVKSGNYNKYLLEEIGVSKEGLEFVDKMLQVEPKKRASADQALRMEWLVPFNAGSEESGPETQFSTMNIDTSSSSIGKEHTAVPNERKTSPQKPLVNGDGLGPPAPIKEGDDNEEMPNAPDLTHDSDSDTPVPRRRETVTPAVEDPPQVAPKAQGKFSIRDMEDDYGEEYEDNNGVWLELDPRGDSVPCKNIKLAEDEVSFGRIILGLKDPRVSKKHCAIKKVQRGDKYEVWLTDTSANGCYVNAVRVGAGNKVQLTDGDLLDLFQDRQGSARTFMGFSVHFTAKDLKQRESESPVVETDENIEFSGLDNGNDVSSEKSYKSAAGTKRLRQLNSGTDDTSRRPLKKLSVMQ